MVEHRAQRAKTPNASIKYSPSFFFKCQTTPTLSRILITELIYNFFVCVNKRNKRQHRKNSTQPQRREASPARLRDLAAKQRDALWSSIMHTGKNKQTNAHMKYSPSRFWQMKSFAILVHSPVSTVTNSPEIWMQITYLKGPNSHFQYNASFWSIVRSRVYTPPLPFASDCIFQMPRADESPPRTHKSFSDNEAKC